MGLIHWRRTRSGDHPSSEPASLEYPFPVAGMGAVPAAAQMTRPANTTQYAANDVIAGANLSVAAASNASPIVITCNGHGLVTGDAVTIASVGGNTAANGNWLITRIDANTFSLDGSTGNGAYTAGGTIVKVLRFADCVRAAGEQGLILSALVVSSAYQSTQLQARLFLFREPVAIALDNAAFAPSNADMRKCVGYLDFTNAWAPGNATSGAGGNCIQQVSAAGLWAKCHAQNTDLFGVLVALNAYTPVSAEVFDVILKLAART